MHSDNASQPSVGGRYAIVRVFAFRGYYTDREEKHLHHFSIR